MSTNFLDIFIISVLVISIFMFLTGNGDTLINLFGGNRAANTDQYDRDKLHRASLIFCVVLLAEELIQLVFGAQIPWFSLASIGITALSLAVYVIYLKKYARK